MRIQNFVIVAIFVSVTALVNQFQSWEKPVTSVTISEISPGMTKAEVISILGQPTRKGSSGEVIADLWYYNCPNPESHDPRGYPTIAFDSHQRILWILGDEVLFNTGQTVRAKSSFKSFDSCIGLPSENYNNSKKKGERFSRYYSSLGLFVSVYDWDTIDSFSLEESGSATRTNVGELPRVEIQQAQEGDL